MSRQLDVVHFIQNAIMLESLSKLILSKADRFLIRRQPKVHLLNNDSERSSDDSTKILTNAYAVSQGDDDVLSSNHGPQLLKLYFGSKPQ